ncbi:RidA family protein [Lacicoccus qingdaonensis]|uniref:RidA family protein n=1 Tax=Lacicoccus qingdaonensis TaxID=576118 RepID=UPI000B84D6EE|nr:RidA family protein [Salinicoccus qingdaonensis]
MENKVTPNGNYKLATRDADKVYTSGITPKINGQLVKTGKLDNQTDLSEYESVTQQAIKNAIQVIDQEISGTEAIDRIIMMTVYVNASVDFESHSKIADFASDYLVDQFGETIIGSRAAVGVSSLPDNAPLEISLIANIK